MHRLYLIVKQRSADSNFDFLDVIDERDYDEFPEILDFKVDHWRQIHSNVGVLKVELEDEFILQNIKYPVIIDPNVTT